MTCELIWSIPSEDEETLLRIRPLREQWEARGPGLLGHLANTLPWLPIPPQATVHLLKPQVGGAGRVVSSTEIEFEAVLANPWPMLPEVVRLGWLVACAGSFTDGKPGKHTVSLIPFTIASAEYVELATMNEGTVECALANWIDPQQQNVSDKSVSAKQPPDAQPTSAQATSAQLFRWWNQLVSDSSNEITQEIWQHAMAEL